MRNLLVRAATGVVLVALVLGAMVLGRVTYTLLLVWIAAWCIMEFGRLAHNIDLSRSRTLKWLGILYIIVCVTAMWFFPYIGGGMTGSLQSLSMGYSPTSLWDSYPAGWNLRIAPSFIVIVWANDVFAYLTGITLGRGGKKLCEKISPNKTIIGFVGGIVGAVAVAVVLGRFVFGTGGIAGIGSGAGSGFQGANLLLWAAFGLAVALASVVGDLAESYFKRRAGVKDSGKVFPGHGGFLDRFDAMLGAAPVAFLFLLVTTLVK